MTKYVKITFLTTPLKVLEYSMHLVKKKVIKLKIYNKFFGINYFVCELQGFSLIVALSLNHYFLMQTMMISSGKFT